MQHKVTSRGNSAGDENMKTINTLSAQKLLGTIAAALFLMASGSAAALEISPEMQAAVLETMPGTASSNAIAHCGCDNKQGIETYVQNLINDAKVRNLDCQFAMHIPACITTYCSICKGHEGLVETCIKTGVEYFKSSAEFCGGKQPGVASYMPDMGSLFKIAK
jgi:hypothetical protein